ncbi:MAG: hypothetical protein LBD38_05540 [Streptococcaceae bacterium]|jgi:hypothetical protein|nr:hypothetical protein [Streptococcaceae bacterium]
MDKEIVVERISQALSILWAIAVVAYIFTGNESFHQLRTSIFPFTVFALGLSHYYKKGMDKFSKLLMIAGAGLFFFMILGIL